jgi:Rieske Fe-S protein
MHSFNAARAAVRELAHSRAVNLTDDQVDVLVYLADLDGRPAGDPTQLGPGDAAIWEVDGEQTAAYRDESGTLHAVSAVCTHLGCTVTWNSGRRRGTAPATAPASATTATSCTDLPQSRFPLARCEARLMCMQLRRRHGAQAVEVTQHRYGWQARCVDDGRQPLVGVGTDPNEALCNLAEAIALRDASPRGPRREDEADVEVGGKRRPGCVGLGRSAAAHAGPREQTGKGDRSQRGPQ